MIILNSFFATILCLVKIASALRNASVLELIPSSEEFTLMYWAHGFPTIHTSAPWHRVILSNTYALVMDTETNSIIHLGRIQNQLLYQEAKHQDLYPIWSLLPNASLDLYILIDGVKFRCVSAGEFSKFEGPRIIDSGKWVQRADSTNLRFESVSDGRILNIEARFEILAWPKVFSFILQARPGLQQLQEGYGTFGRVGAGFGLINSKNYEITATVLNEFYNFTVEFWAFIPSDFTVATSFYPWLLCKGANEYADGNYGVYILNGKTVRGVINIGTGASNMYTVQKSDILIFKRWNHFALSYDGQTLALSVNGNLVGQSNVGKVRNLKFNSPVYIGRRGDGYQDGYRFKGAIDEIKFYNKALTPEEIGSRYANPLLNDCSEIRPSEVYGFNNGSGMGLGKIQGGFGLDKNSIYEIPHTTSFEISTFSIEFWTYVLNRTENLEPNEQIMLSSKLNINDDGFIGISTDASGHVWGKVNIGGGSEGLYSIKSFTPVFSFCSWNHIVFQYNDSWMEIYVNGVIAGSSYIGIPRTVYGNMPLIFSCKGFSSPLVACYGFLDEVRLYSSSLSVDQISERYTHPEIEIDSGLKFKETFGVSNQVLIPERYHFPEGTMGIEFSTDSSEFLDSKNEIRISDWSWNYAEVHLGIDALTGLNISSLDPQISINAVELNNNRILTTLYNQSRAQFEIDVNNLDPILPDNTIDAYSNDAYEKVGLYLYNPSNRAEDFRIMFEKQQKSNTRPIALRLGFPITGISAVIRDDQGNSVGIPIQLSKNWHGNSLAGFYNGQWFHGYTKIVLPANSQIFLELWIIYGNWGGIPKASHAQLSLIGWGTNQLWEQSAIGSWGESITYESDQILAQSAVLDIRPLLVNGMTNNDRYSWTHNVGGADWLRIFGTDQVRLRPYSVVTKFLKYGPCLTQAVFSGLIGTGINYSVSRSISSSDDFVRGTFKIRMDVSSLVEFSRFVIFQIGTDSYCYTAEKKMAYGNIEAGLIEEWNTTWGGETYHHHVLVSGEMPWISLHDAEPQKFPGAWANRGIILRSWKANIGGFEVYPLFAERGTTVKSLQTSLIDLILPFNITHLAPGDFIEATIQMNTFPQFESEYYGPNVDFQKAMNSSQNTWKPLFREASKNRRIVNMLVGELVSVFPSIEIKTFSGLASFMITHSISYIPITFTNLPIHDGFVLYLNNASVDQSVHGKDFWQTDFDYIERTWSITYNIFIPEEISNQSVHVYLTNPSLELKTNFPEIPVTDSPEIPEIPENPEIPKNSQNQEISNLLSIPRLINLSLLLLLLL